MTDPATKRPTRPREPLRELDVADFPGCEAVSMTAEELERYEGRLEYWEARTSTAMIVAEATTTYHEIPVHRVTGLVEVISLARGSEILALGAAALVQYGDAGNYEVVAQADAIFCLHRPWPKDKAIDIDVGPLPDVLLEVDHTTDVRRRKLEVYASWGIPEVWVEKPSPAWLAPRESGKPRLVIYLLEGNGYVTSASSRAFPGWTAAEIHRALNEEVRSGKTVAALRRVGRRMGRMIGASPDDDLFLAAERAESRAEGRAAGRAEGRAEGRAAGRAEGRAAGRAEGRAAGRVEGRLETIRCLVRQTLEMRGIPVAGRVETWLAGLETVPSASALIAAADECEDADDFLRRALRTASAPR